MKKPTFCMFISAVAMASVLLVSCSLGDWNNYFDGSVVSWAVGDSEDFGWRIEDVTIPRDGTLHARVQVSNVSPQAAALTLLAQNGARYDVFDPVDPIVRFLNITIER